MILVFLLLGLFGIASLLILLLSISTLKIKVIRLHISNNENKLKLKFVSNLSIYLFNKIKIFSIKLDEIKTRDILKSKKINISKIVKGNSNLDIARLLRNSDFKIEELYLSGYLGIEDAALTAFIITIINIAISIFIAKKEYKRKKYYYKIDAVYKNQNIVNLYFNCIINIKIVNIINIIYILKKKGRVNKNERTSNRRAYAYSHE